MDNNIMNTQNNIIEETISGIKTIIDQAREKVTIQVNQELLSSYWQIGRIIVKYEQND